MLVDANVRYGSLAYVSQRPRHVCFTPNSGHWSVQVKCPLCAKSGRWEAEAGLIKRDHSLE
ncbi:MAG: hypothetical protein WBQ20_17500, partial [Methyloceanibacter sp.]